MTHQPTLTDLIPDFLAAWNGNTTSTYQRAINQFLDWTDRPLENIDRAHAQAFINHLKTLKLADATIRLRRSSLSSFYTYAMTEDATDKNPFQLVRVPKGGGALRSGISWDAADQLLNTAAGAGPNPHALVRILLTTGCRISAVCADPKVPKPAAQITDLSTDGDTPVLQVRLKGGRTDRLPLAPKTHEAILTAIGTRTRGPILQTTNNTPLTRSTGGRWIKQLAQQTGLGHVTPHHLRHTCATLLAEEGVNPIRIQRLLGHQSIETTMRYVHLVENLTDSPVHLLDQLGDPTE